MTNEKLLTIADLQSILSLSKSSIYNYINRNILPPPIKFRRASRWRLSEIYEAILRLKAGQAPEKDPPLWATNRSEPTI